MIALWALAGGTMEEKRSVATLIGVHLLVELLGSKSNDLLVRACQAIETLCLGPHNKQQAIGATPGIWRLESLIISMPLDRPQLLCASLRALSALFLGPGFVPHKRNQDTLSSKRLLDILVDLATNCENPLVQAESAITLAAAVMGNKANEVIVRDAIGGAAPSNENLTEKEKVEQAKAMAPRLTIVAVKKLLYHEDKEIAVLGGRALATLAFNSFERGHAIETAGGLRIKSFASFLRSPVTWVKIDAAFQILVLSRMIPDADPATICAQSIQILSQILTNSHNSDELYL